MVVFPAPAAADVFDVDPGDVPRRLVNGLVQVFAVHCGVADVEIDAERVATDLVDEVEHFGGVLDEQFGSNSMPTSTARNSA